MRNQKENKKLECQSRGFYICPRADPERDKRKKLKEEEILKDEIKENFPRK